MFSKLTFQSHVYFLCGLPCSYHLLLYFLFLGLLCYLFLRVLNILRFIIFLSVSYVHIGQIIDGLMTFAPGIASVILLLYNKRDFVDVMRVTIRLTLRQGGYVGKPNLNT